MQQFEIKITIDLLSPMSPLWFVGCTPSSGYFQVSIGDTNWDIFPFMFHSTHTHIEVFKYHPKFISYIPNLMMVTGKVTDLCDKIHEPNSKEYLDKFSYLIQISS